MGRPKIKPDTIAQVAKRYKERKTPKQIKFLRNLHKTLTENHAIESISYGQIMRDSGYSEVTARKPSNVLEAKAIKPELQEIVNKFTDVRNKAIAAITHEKLIEAPAKDLAQVADKFQKNINLLVGNATENRVTQTIKFDITAIK